MEQIIYRYMSQMSAGVFASFIMSYWFPKSITEIIILGLAIGFMLQFTIDTFSTMGKKLEN